MKILSLELWESKTMARRRRSVPLGGKPDEWYIVVKQLDKDLGELPASTGWFKEGLMKTVVFDRLKSAIQHLFSQIAKPLPMGPIGYAIRGHHCMIEVVGPAGPSSPIWRFETLFTQHYGDDGKSIETVWKIRDPDTGKNHVPESLIAADFCFVVGD